ncbi:phosphatidate cytidylyltransferase [Hesseltinella vesiculosa]|uniref:Phosphatidate cytidylyltransferase n=1 Tax=Hesseltinella vesiculosa TaxID=101127 RepID=A0A1X2G4E8_9FUNG|nr:phosphatidate cytidylyltransferase [Hesseltinella vesiculosa]
MASQTLTELTEEKSSAVVPTIDAGQNKKWQTFWLRTVTTFMMIGGFFAVLASGHVWVVLMVMAMQTMIYKEVIHIAEPTAKERQLLWFKTMSWYFLVITTYFLYGETIIDYFQHIVLVDAFLLPLATHHRFISFMLYVTGFVLFVLNLKKGLYKQQLAQFGWMHMALLLIVCQSHYIVKNTLEGLIWFVLPSSLVICNDVFAYICGTFWGKTPLIHLSPKKTVEGFLGAWLCTLMFAFLVGRLSPLLHLTNSLLFQWVSLLMQWDYMICPVKDLATSSWNYSHCESKNPVFVTAPWQLPTTLSSLLNHMTGCDVTQIWLAPIQFHAVIMACFASLIAPFGGFFASAVKRAFKIKDFGDSIPGHGGMTDRMDCQLMMGLFAYMYLHSFIKIHDLSTGSILNVIIHRIPLQGQLELLEHLLTYFVNQEILHPLVLEQCGVSALTDTAKPFFDTTQ